MLKTEPKQQTKGERTREAITDGALIILHESGYQSLSIAALADGAGIRRNSYYTHYNDLSQLVDEISLMVVNYIGRKSLLEKSDVLNSPSIVLRRLRTVLKLKDTDPIIASALSELYANHTGSSREIQRRLSLDISTDRRKNLLQIGKNEATLTAMILAAGAMELMRARHTKKKGEQEDFLRLVAKLCGIDLSYHQPKI